MSFVSARILPIVRAPLLELGTVSFYLFWVVAVTGVYLFVFFETSIDGAYSSVESITHEHFLIGGIIRSIHRYASAAMAITVTTHLLRELVSRRFQGARWFSWVTGVPLLWLLFASAIGGYWLVWDQKAQYIALSTAELFDSLPIVVEPMAFGFLDNATVSDRFFSLLIFLHIGIPLALLLGMFIHIKRVNHVKVMPGRSTALIVLGALIVVSLLVPAVSMLPANLDAPLHDVQIDWFYMNLFPLMQSSGPALAGIGLLLLTGGLLALPFVFKEKHAKVAVVDPEFCNGCTWCYQDCPFEAIYMTTHESKPGHEQAVVIADNCVGCGICAGACPSITPFRSFNEASSGIDLEGLKNTDVIVDVRRRLQQVKADHRILVVGCAHGVDLDVLAADDVITLELECIGQLPPSYIDFLCRRDDVSTVLLTGCETDNCFHRLGIQIQEERLEKLREPHLRYGDVKERIDKFWIGRGGEAALLQRVDQIRANARVPAMGGDEEQIGNA